MPQSALCALESARMANDGLLGVAASTEIMPTFLPITLGGVVRGYIFVLLDNILVITDDETLTRKWQERITRNVNLFNLEIKVGNETGFVTLPGHPEGEAMSETEPQHTLTFAGVEFSERGWRSSSGDRPIPEWRGTRRQALQTAGTLLWDIRVRQGNLRDHPQLRLLYREIGTHVNGTGRDGLDVGHRRHSLQYCMGCPTAPGAPPEAGEQGSDPC